MHFKDMETKATKDRNHLLTTFMHILFACVLIFLDKVYFSLDNNPLIACFCKEIFYYN